MNKENISVLVHMLHDERKTKRWKPKIELNMEIFRAYVLSIEKPIICLLYKVYSTLYNCIYVVH